MMYLQGLFPPKKTFNSGVFNGLRWMVEWALGGFVGFATKRRRLLGCKRDNLVIRALKVIVSR